jgi:CheY-like chemotaxis protein
VFSSANFGFLASSVQFRRGVYFAHRVGGKALLIKRRLVPAVSSSARSESDDSADQTCDVSLGSEDILKYSDPGVTSSANSLRRLRHGCPEVGAENGHRPHFLEKVPASLNFNKQMPKLLLSCMPRLKNVTIVIVEDHADARALIGAFLRQEGANVISASNGFEGLEAIRAHHPDLVLSDLVMGGRDGFELLNDIRALGAGEGGSVPVIAMTAVLRYADRRTQEAGFQMHLAKPFGPKQLLDAIGTVLRK